MRPPPDLDSKNLDVEEPGRKDSLQSAIPKLFIELGNVGDGRAGELPDIHAVFTRDPLQQKIVRPLRPAIRATDRVRQGGRGLITLRTRTHEIQIDPQDPVQDDFELTCQFGALALRHAERQTVEVQIFGRPGVITFVHRCEKADHARTWNPPVQLVVGCAGGLALRELRA